MKAISSLLVLLLVFASSRLYAHHAYAADFDPDAYDTVVGEVVEIFFINPHSQYVIEVTTADGSVQDWAVIMQNLQTMASVGWREDSVELGEVISVHGRLGRDGRPLIWPQTVTRENGEVLDLGVGGPLK